MSELDLKRDLAFLDGLLTPEQKLALTRSREVLSLRDATDDYQRTVSLLRKDFQSIAALANKTAQESKTGQRLADLIDKRLDEAFAHPKILKRIVDLVHDAYNENATRWLRAHEKQHSYKKRRKGRGKK